MNDDRWERFAVYADAASAEAVAGLLRSESIAVRVAADEPVPGLVHAISLMVPARSLRRAREALNQASISDEELSSLATGTPGEENPE